MEPLPLKAMDADRLAFVSRRGTPVATILNLLIRWPRSFTAYGSKFRLPLRFSLLNRFVDALTPMLDIFRESARKL